MDMDDRERVITQIEKYRNNKYRIFINDEFAFLLYKTECSSFGLEEGVALTDEAYSLIFSEILEKRAKLYAMNLLRKQDRTERDLKRKLSEALYPEETIEQAIKYVKDFGYLDDVRYAFNYIRLSASRYGKAELKNKLQEKGISGEDIEEAYRQAAEEGFIDENTEEELIEKLIRKKYRDITELENADRDKLYASLYRKGFTVRSVEKVLRRILT